MDILHYALIIVVAFLWIIIGVINVVLANSSKDITLFDIVRYVICWPIDLVIILIYVVKDGFSGKG